MQINFYSTHPAILTKSAGVQATPYKIGTFTFPAIIVGQDAPYRSVGFLRLADVPMNQSKLWVYGGELVITDKGHPVLYNPIVRVDDWVSGEAEAIVLQLRTAPPTAGKVEYPEITGKVLTTGTASHRASGAGKWEEHLVLLQPGQHVLVSIADRWGKRETRRFANEDGFCTESSSDMTSST